MLFRPPPQEPDTPQEFSILFEDDELFVVDKPAGMTFEQAAATYDEAAARRSLLEDYGLEIGGGLGDLFGMAMNQFGAAQHGNAQQVRDAARGRMPAGADYAQMERRAELLVEAMINAAKADGRVDAEEQQKIVDRLGEVSREELEFVRRELAGPLDVQGFIGRAPRGMERDVYAVSLMAIDLDSNPEAQYLHQLAQGVGLSADACNEIHEALGAPKLYR